MLDQSGCQKKNQEEEDPRLVTLRLKGSLIIVLVALFLIIVGLHIACIMGCTVGMIIALIVMYTFKQGDILEEKYKHPERKEEEETEDLECERFM